MLGGGTPSFLPVIAEWWEPPGLCLCVLSHEQRLRACLQETGVHPCRMCPQNPGKDAPGFRTRGREPGYPCR